VQENPFDEDASYETVRAALVASERKITDVFALPSNTALTYASLYGMGVGRRALALSSGFRAMIEQRNSLCAMPMVRMQLDTAIRFYAGFFVSDHQQFCRDVLQGKQIDKMKSDEGEQMRDRYLVERLARRNPWMMDVYKASSGYIHFSHRHIQEAVRSGDGANVQMVIGPTDFDRGPEHFREPMRCMHHLNLIIEFALQDWFKRMCDPNGITVSAKELWTEPDNEASD
jgi:hypothetical protein